MIPDNAKAEGVGVLSVDNTPYMLIKGKKVLKVIEPYYCSEQRIITAFCPHCGLEVNRVWNLEYCGNCGAQISWHRIHVRGYGDID